MFLDSEGVEELRLIGDEGELRFHCHRLVGQRETADRDATGGGAKDANEAAKGGGLPGPVRTHQPEYLAGGHGEGEVAHRVNGAVALRELFDEDQGKARYGREREALG